MEGYVDVPIVPVNSIDAIRKRPGMYIGGTGKEGLHNLLWELVSNSVDEHLAGFASTIAIAIERDRITIHDDGRGIPADHLTRVFTELHGGTAQRPHVHLRGELMGIGVAPTCALSCELDVTVWRDEIRHRQAFARGVPLGPIAQHRDARGRGMRISFRPDPDIFGRLVRWDGRAIGARCRELVAMFPGLTIELDGEALRSTGFGAFVAARCSPRFEPFELRTTEDGIELHVAIAWSGHVPGAIHQFVNGSPTMKGAHVDGLLAGVEAAFAKRFAWNARWVRKRMTAMINVIMADPKFGAPTKDWFSDPDAGEVVRRVIAREYGRYLRETPALLDALILERGR